MGATFSELGSEVLLKQVLPHSGLSIVAALVVVIVSCTRCVQVISCLGCRVFYQDVRLSLHLFDIHDTFTSTYVPRVQADAPNFLVNKLVHLTYVSFFCGPTGNPVITCSFPAVQRTFVVHTLQIRIKAGEDPLPDTVDLVLIDTHEEALSADTWVDLIRPLVQVLSENGVIVVRGPREETASTTVNQEKKGLGGANGGWYGIADLWEAIVVEACDGEHGFAAAVGDLDG